MSSSNSPEDQQKPDSLPGGRSRKDVLVVDDSPELLEWMKLDLEGRGYQVFTALNGEGCIQQVELLHPPCVLLDVMMPGSPKLVAFLDEHRSLRRDCTLLLDESVYCLRERVHKSLYEILSSHGSEFPSLARDEKGQLLVYQRAELVYGVVSEAAFLERFGEAHIHLDGYATCQILTSCGLFKGVHIILFTAGGSGTRNERVQKAFQAGASDYLLKSEYYTHLFERLEHYTSQED